MTENKPKRILINLVADEETRQEYNQLKKESGYTPHGFIKHLLSLYKEELRLKEEQNQK